MIIILEKAQTTGIFPDIWRGAGGLKTGNAGAAIGVPGCYSQFSFKSKFDPVCPVYAL
jgi:hypothetical protein